MSKTFSIRLTGDELKKLDHMVASPARFCENRTEFLRLLIYREFNRTHKRGIPSVHSYQTAFRVGRPIKKPLDLVTSS